MCVCVCVCIYIYIYIYIYGNHSGVFGDCLLLQVVDLVAVYIEGNGDESPKDLSSSYVLLIYLVT